MATRKEQGRVFAIGDIHGCYKELLHLINYINPTYKDTLIFLGDYVDRGCNSKAVLDLILELNDYCEVIALKGNHESMMQNALMQNDDSIKTKWAINWLRNGGRETLSSYGVNADIIYKASDLPVTIKKHLNFINSMPTYYITDTHIFVHATPRLDIDIELQSDMDLLWRRASNIDKQMDYTHLSDKIIISGHTAQVNGKPLYLSDKNIIIDSGCFYTGWLTAVNIDNGQVIQSSKDNIRLI